MGSLICVNCRANLNQTPKILLRTIILLKQEGDKLVDEKIVLSFCNKKCIKSYVNKTFGKGISIVNKVRR